ncbi:unnamed protein product [Rotaria sordida]|uniref:Uncharacterized protein n=1 Tax=Rotaria sordida TaxID=392033 RepID=A0A815PQ24_9BILA|nr:unnamed protein product [Rotaria sordida]
METIERIIQRFQQYCVIQIMFVVYSDRDTDNHLSLIIDNLYIFRIQESMFELLEKRIEEVKEQNLSDEVSNSQSFPSIYLYRGAKLKRDEFEQLQVGCRVITNESFTCSYDRNATEIFIGIDLMIDRSTNSNRDAWQQFVLFIIDVDHRTSTDTILAYVSHESKLSDQNVFKTPIQRFCSVIF